MGMERERSIYGKVFKYDDISSPVILRNRECPIIILSTDKKNKLYNLILYLTECVKNENVLRGLEW